MNWPGSQVQPQATGEVIRDSPGNMPIGGGHPGLGDQALDAHQMKENRGEAQLRNLTPEMEIEARGDAVAVDGQRFASL